MEKKVLIILYSLFNPRDDEIDYINKLINFIESDKFLKKNIEVFIFDDTIENKFKGKFKNMINVNENVKKNGAIIYSLDYLNGKYLKFVDPDDFINFNLLEKLVQNLKNEESDLVQHSFFILKDKKMKYKNFKNIRYANYNSIYKIDQLKKNKVLIKKNMLYTQDQLIGLITNVNGTVKRINVPFYIYNRNSEGSIWNNVSNQTKDFEKIFKDVKLNIDAYNKYYKNIHSSAKPRFIRAMMFKSKFKNRINLYSFVLKNVKVKSVKINIWIFFAIFIKYRWI